MKKVMLFGTFDILHKGHENLFKQARKYGDFLIACVARDKNVKNFKGCFPFFKEKQRLLNLKKSQWPDRVCLGDKKNFLKPILRHKPDIICLGYDQKIPVKELRKKLKGKKLNIKFIKLKSFKSYLYKSSILRKKYAGH